MARDTLSIFSPLPPERNGIADYTYHLLSPLSRLFDCVAYVEDASAVAPPDVQVRDALQAFRYMSPNGRKLHQIGNNPGHVFVLKALRLWGGVTTLHDQNLHYLYEVAGTDKAAMMDGMMATSPALGLAYARHWHETGVKTHANYVLFDMLDETLSTSHAVVVHSAFAKRRLALLYGEARCTRVEVIPHLALPFDPADRPGAAAGLQLPQDRPLVVTSGFATNAKRFDWLVAALNEVVARGIDFFWVHAGMEKPDEFSLSSLLRQYPAVQERSRITGYLTEDDLNAYINACDVLVNLRFPSVGESSGTLARAMGLGKCCFVSDTAAYADLPRGSVVHIPIHRTVPRLIDALDAFLTKPDARAAIGAGASMLVEQEWLPEKVAARYGNVLRQAGPLAKRRAGRVPRKAPTKTHLRLSLGPATTQAKISAAAAGMTGAIEFFFVVSSLEWLAIQSLTSSRFLMHILPPSFQLASVRLERVPATKPSARTKELLPEVVLRVSGRLQG